MTATGGDADGSWLIPVARGLQVLLVGLIGYGAVAGNTGLVVNGVLALAITLVPALLNWRYDHRIAPHLVVWITVAAVAHTAGFLGPYGAQSGIWSWYDQAAHAISASFVAGVGYAVIAALDHGSARVRFPEEFRFVFTLCFILAFGVAWEIVEFATGEVSTMVLGTEALVQYGKDDIVFDLLFNTLAGALVALWGTAYFRSVTAAVSRFLPRAPWP